MLIRHNHLKTTKQSQSLDVVCKKVNLNIFKNKKCINQATTKPLRNIHSRVSFHWSRRLKAYNFPENKTPKRRFSQSLLKREEDHRNRTSFVDTSESQETRKTQLNQKTRTKFHLENLPSLNLNHPLSPKKTRCHLKSGFWVGNRCHIVSKIAVTARKFIYHVICQ